MAKILIAEDETDIRELIKLTLTFNGYDVVSARDGAEAVEIAQKEVFDLILMDVYMPRMDGYKACARLKEIETTREIPIIFLSAKGQEGEVQQGLDAGASEYIVKPFAPDELAAKVPSFLS